MTRTIPRRCFTLHMVSNDGFTLVEMLLSIVIAGLIIAGLVGVVSGALDLGSDAAERNTLARDARFAMQRMCMR